MRVLVTWGSRHGGTEGIGRIIAESLRQRGFDVVAQPVGEVKRLAGYEAVVLGGALYGFRWLASVRRFVRRHAKELRQVPVWLFSSGPLDASADRGDVPPVRQVEVLAERIGARGHVTFGGRLEPGSIGPRASMPQGDWRNPEHVRRWAGELAALLPGARPGTAIDHPGRSLSRLLWRPVVGWAVCAGALALLLAAASPAAALAVQAVLAPLVFAALAWSYFRVRGAREPLHVAALWTAVFVALDLGVVALAVQRSLRLFTSVAGTWLPFALIFFSVWVTGLLMTMMPWQEIAPPRRPTAGHA